MNGLVETTQTQLVKEKQPGDHRNHHKGPRGVQDRHRRVIRGFLAGKSERQALADEGFAPNVGLKQRVASSNGFSIAWKEELEKVVSLARESTLPGEAIADTIEMKMMQNLIRGKDSVASGRLLTEFKKVAPFMHQPEQQKVGVFLNVINDPVDEGLTNKMLEAMREEDNSAIARRDLSAASE